MKIIFLDIDGVLNSEETALAWNKITPGQGYGGHFPETKEISVNDVKWGETLFKNLRKIVEDTGAKIVISSTWRLHFSLAKFKEMFALYGWQDPPIIDATNNWGHIRGDQIQAWLDNHEDITHYVILDDASDMLPSQNQFLVQTDYRTGLQIEQEERAIQLLNDFI